MELTVLRERLCVCRLPPDAPWPSPPGNGGFYSATLTQAEISVVCEEDAAPPGARVDNDWRALEVAGPLDFSMVGVMAALTGQLAEVEVSVFVLSTFDTDYVMVHAAALERAVAALRAAGHHVEAA